MNCSDPIISNWNKYFTTTAAFDQLFCSFSDMQGGDHTDQGNSSLVLEQRSDCVKNLRSEYIKYNIYINKFCLYIYIYVYSIIK